ncbi:MAG: hypothetical protein ACRDCC_08260 [Culicoidibacterales bacterium]
MFDWLFDFLQNLTWGIVDAFIWFTNEMWSGVFALTSTHALSTITEIPILATIIKSTTLLGGAIIALVCVITLIKNMIELDGQANTMVYRRTLFAIIWMFLSIAAFDTALPIVQDLAQAAVSISGKQDEGNFDFSTNIASSLLSQETANQQEYKPIIQEQIKNGTFDASLRCGDEAAKGMCASDANKDGYVYSLGSMGIILILCFVTALLTAVIGIQVARRLLETVVLKALAPLCASSWISDAQATRARTWQKMATGVLLATAGQLFALSISLVVFDQINNIINADGTAFVYGYILLVIGIILFVIFTPTTINTLVDGQTSLSEGFQELMTIKGGMDLAKGAVGGLAAIGGVAGGLAKGVGSMATGAANMASKMATGQSLSTLSANANASSGGLGGGGASPTGGVNDSGSIGEANSTYGDKNQSAQASTGSASPTGGANAQQASTESKSDGGVPPLSPSQGVFGKVASTAKSVGNTVNAMKSSYANSGGGFGGAMASAAVIGGVATSAMKGVANRVGEKTGATSAMNTVTYGARLAYAQAQSPISGVTPSSPPKQSQGDESG